MVAAVHFIATVEDHAAMLDYLDEPNAVTLHPWPVVSTPLNWDRVSPAGDDGLVDSNASPVIFWEPGPEAGAVLHGSSLGSQADSMSAIGADYERWVTRPMGWIKRRGTKVWGLERGRIRPDLDIDLSHVSAVYALPRALAAMERGAPAR